MRPDGALFDDAATLGFPRLPIRPAVSVIAGRAAWERFTTNGTEEDLAAARIAVAVRLRENAHAARASVTSVSDQGEGSPAPGVTLARAQCAFCGASLRGRRERTRYCGGRCRVAASRRRDPAGAAVAL